jgi:glucosamine--fructose-6-phosphate aminotransferase (isomerizing)
MKTLGVLTYPEISEQTEAISAAMKQVENENDWIRHFFSNEEYDEVIFIGSGSSYYQALTMASTFRKWLGRSASAYPSSEIFLFREQATVSNKKYLLVGVSRSGESTEVILALNSVKDLDNWTICGITCYEDSTMAKLCQCIVSSLGKEKSTVMTKSFSSMTFMMQGAIALAAGRNDLIAELKKTIHLDEQVVKQSDIYMKELVQDQTFNKFIYLGMGAYNGTALEACLKIKEMSYVWTESYGTLEFRHGPKSIVEPGTLVCLLVSEQARAYELKVAEEMKEYGAYVLLIISKKDADTEFADAVLEIGGKDISDEARTVLYLPALQYLGYYTALKLKVDPDSPRNLSQVVKI